MPVRSRASGAPAFPCPDLLLAVRLPLVRLALAPRAGPPAPERTEALACQLAQLGWISTRTRRASPEPPGEPAWRASLSTSGEGPYGFTAPGAGEPPGWRAGIIRGARALVRSK